MPAAGAGSPPAVAAARIYLGQDNCSNFDIIRNVDMGVALCLTRNLDNVSWKIDPDVDYNGSLCSAYVEQGLHGLDNIYVGETSLPCPA